MAAKNFIDSVGYPSNIVNMAIVFANGCLFTDPVDARQH